MDSWENCPGNQSIKFYVNVKTDSVGVATKLVYSGYLDVTQTVPGPLDLSLDINRCDISMKKCEKRPSHKFTGLCQRVHDRNTFYHGALSTINPPLVCPLKPQRYVATNSTIDLTAISFMPVNGYIWHTTVKLHSGEGKDRKVAMCIEMKMKIVRAQARKRN